VSIYRPLTLTQTSYRSTDFPSVMPETRAAGPLQKALVLMTPKRKPPPKKKTKEPEFGKMGKPGVPEIPIPASLSCSPTRATTFVPSPSETHSPLLSLEDNPSPLEEELMRVSLREQTILQRSFELQEEIDHLKKLLEEKDEEIQQLRAAAERPDPDPGVHVRGVPTLSTNTFVDQAEHVIDTNNLQPEPQQDLNARLLAIEKWIEKQYGKTVPKAKKKKKEGVNKNDASSEVAENIAGGSTSSGGEEEKRKT